MDSDTILIADSGSTKTQWQIISQQETPGEACVTAGINPFYQSNDEILKCLQKEFTIKASQHKTIYFYGAGCANEEKNAIVRKALQEYFGVDSVFISSDLLGAARSLCQDKKGIACIMGTGSNSCFYDGSAIINNVSPLGFILGDEGSGAVLGKKLVADVLKKQLPDTIINLFFDTYKTTTADILNNIYKQPFPNRYLAQYSKFLSANIHIEELESLCLNAFSEFVDRNLLQYEHIDSLPIHFTGSIAWHFSDLLKKVLEKYQLQPGNFSQSPMDGLVQYHQLTR